MGLPDGPELSLSELLGIGLTFTASSTAVYNVLPSRSAMAAAAVVAAAFVNVARTVIVVFLRKCRPGVPTLNIVLAGRALRRASIGAASVAGRMECALTVIRCRAIASSQVVDVGRTLCAFGLGASCNTGAWHSVGGSTLRASPVGRAASQEGP